MSRFVVVAVLVLSLCGCRAPQPSWNFLAPYGSPTVPPPPTGSVGVSGDYYAPPASDAPAATSGGAVGTGTQQPAAVPPGNFMGSSYTPAVTRNTPTVAQASYESTDTPQPLPMGKTDGRARASASSRGGSQLQLNGMPVNDGTQVAEPLPFQPPGTATNLADLPPAQTPSLSRILGPGSSYNRTPTPAPTQPPANISGDSWHSR